MARRLLKFCRRSKNRWLPLLLSVILAVSINIGYRLPSYGNPWLDILLQGIQILQISQLSDAQEVQLGEEINQNLLTGNDLRLNRNPQLNRYLNKIGQRIAKTSDRSNIPYTFQIIEDDSVNAFATMGGFVYINTGLMVKAENEAELASVVAHEVGHIVARHSIKGIQRMAIAQGLMRATGLDQSDAIKLGVEVGFNLPRSRENELEADQLGLTNLTRSGYAPIAMVTFMETLLQYSGGTNLAILSTHPDTEKRIIQLRQQLNQATAYRGDGLNHKEYQSQIRSLF